MEAKYRKIASTKNGYVTAAAGCGKTEAIVQSVLFCEKKQLILTHTHAGVSALKTRFRKNNIPSTKYHIETISGWALSWVIQYPIISGYNGSLPFPTTSAEWQAMYEAASRLLDREFVQFGIKNSYEGLFVDEYQDCTIPMHNLILKLKGLIGCRAFGDPLQGIFSFSGQSAISWSSVESDFQHSIETLEIPYRWNNAGNPSLGEWLINSRALFSKGSNPTSYPASITFENVQASTKAIRITKIIRELEGTICIIGPKHGNIHSPLLSSLVSIGFIRIEPNDLPILNTFIEEIANGSGALVDHTINFLKDAFAKFSDHKPFVNGILKSTIRREPQDTDQKAIFNSQLRGCTPETILVLLKYLQVKKLVRKMPASIDCLMRSLEIHIEIGTPLKQVVAQQIMLRKVNSKSKPNRCIGSTLLLKGLEFDHAIILFDSTATINDNYVALSRAAKSIKIIS